VADTSAGFDGLGLNLMGRHSRNGTGSIPSHRVAILRPFARFLTDVGAPVERGFQRACLPYLALENVDNYVPSQRFYGFLVDMAFREGIEDLGFHVGQSNGADNVDPHLTELLRRSPTLYQGLVAATDLANKTVTHSQMGIWQSSRSGRAYFYHRPSCDLANPAIRQIGWFGIMTLIGMARVFTGPHWQPIEIGLMTRHEPCLSIREQLRGTRLRHSQPCSYIALERSLLSLPPWSDEAAPSAFPTLTFKPLANDLAGSLKQILPAYIEERDLSVGFAAELCNTSRRSLQRKLGEMGTSYSEVLDHARFDVASRMLQDPDMKVLDVAHRLGYSDPTSFSRAFRRIAGISPRVYRTAYRH